MILIFFFYYTRPLLYRLSLKRKTNELCTEDKKKTRNPVRSVWIATFTWFQFRLFWLSTVSLHNGFYFENTSTYIANRAAEDQHNKIRFIQTYGMGSCVWYTKTCILNVSKYKFCSKYGLMSLETSNRVVFW